MKIPPVPRIRVVERSSADSSELAMASNGVSPNEAKDLVREALRVRHVTGESVEFAASVFGPQPVKFTMDYSRSPRREKK